MSLLYQSSDLALPWSSSKREDSCFLMIVIVALCLTFAFSFLIQNIEVKKLTKEELKKIPDSVVKFQKRKPVAPKLKNKVVVKVAEKKVKVKVNKKKPPKPKSEQEKKAREKAKKQLDQIKNELAVLQDLYKPLSSGKKLAKGDKVAKFDKTKVIGTSADAKGIGETLAVPIASNLGSLSDRAAIEVSGSEIGSTQVDGGGAVAKAINGRNDKSRQRSEEQIRAAFDSSKGGLYAVYNRELRKDPSLRGKVTFEIVIEADGSVSAAKIIDSELNSSVLEAKLLRRLRIINFGKEDVVQIKTRWAIDFLPY